MNEIRQKVAQNLRVDYLEMLTGKLAQKSTRTRRRSRSGGRKRDIWSPFFSLLALGSYSNSRVGSRQHMAASRQWNRDVKSTVKKYWKSYFDPYIYRRAFPVVNINTPSAKRVCKLVNQLHKALIVRGNKVFGSANSMTFYGRYLSCRVAILNVFL